MRIAPVLGMLVWVACGADDSRSADHWGDPTGQSCPSDSTLTYGTFGQKFMADYCLRCHSSTAVARGAAHSEFIFDDLAMVRRHRSYIDEVAALPRVREKHGGVEEKPMPPDGAKPTDEERFQLAEWLACGAR